MCHTFCLWLTLAEQLLRINHWASPNLYQHLRSTAWYCAWNGAFRLAVIAVAINQDPVFPGMDRLIVIMGIPIVVRRHLYIETTPLQSAMLSCLCNTFEDRAA